MTGLILETSTKKACIILENNAQVLGVFHLPYNFYASKNLVFHIKELLMNHNIQMSSLTYVAVGRGPGSYTGIRVGVSVAQALSYALNIPLVGFCSLKSFLPQQSCSFVSMIDAKTRGVYMLEGEKNKQNVHYKKTASIASLVEVESLLQKENATPISPDAISLNKRTCNKATTIQDVIIDTKHLSFLVHNKYRKKEYSLDNKVDIFYLGHPGIDQ